MNVHARGTVSADGSPLHPGRAFSAGEAELWQRVRPVLLGERSGRPQPARDDKVVAGWNGLAVAALAEAGAVLEQPRLVAAAERIAAYLERVHWRPGAGGEPGTLRRVSHDGVARGIGGLLEDYAFCVEGLIALYAVTGRTRWYRLADGHPGRSLCAVHHGRHAQGRRGGVGPGVPRPGRARAAGAVRRCHAERGGRLRRRAAVLLGPLRLPGTPRPRRQHPFAAAAAGGPRATGGRLAARHGAGGARRPGGGRRRRAGHAGAGGAAPRAAALAEPRAGDRTAGSPCKGKNSRGQRRAGQCLPDNDEPDNDGGDAAVPLLRGRGAAPDGAPQVYLCRGMVCGLPVRSPGQLRERLATMAE